MLKIIDDNAPSDIEIDLGEIEKWNKNAPADERISIDKIENAALEVIEGMAADLDEHLSYKRESIMDNWIDNMHIDINEIWDCDALDEAEIEMDDIFDKSELISTAVDLYHQEDDFKISFIPKDKKR